MREGELLTMGGGGGGQRLFTTNNKYLCSKKCDNRGLPQKWLWEASPKMPPPPHAEKETPHTIFCSCSPPRGGGEGLLTPPLAGADHDFHSLYSVCLREFEKINKKLNKTKFFWLFHFLRGGDGIASNTNNHFIY